MAVNVNTGNKGAALLLGATAIAIGVYVATRNTSGGGGNPPPPPEKVIPGWIKPFVQASWSAGDLANLATYPENPSAGQYVLVFSQLQGNAWITAQNLPAFLKPIGEWSALAYPYPA